MEVTNAGLRLKGRLLPDNPTLDDFKQILGKPICAQVFEEGSPTETVTFYWVKSSGELRCGHIQVCFYPKNLKVFSLWFEGKNLHEKKKNIKIFGKYLRFNQERLQKRLQEGLHECYLFKSKDGKSTMRVTPWDVEDGGYNLIVDWLDKK